MHIHILGICGTFMGGVASLAKAMGFEVTGSDKNIYPPMSTQLEQQGIELFHGFSAKNLIRKPDLVIIGNVMQRGNEELEAVLNQRLPYISGPQWLAEVVLKNYRVLAVAGTHGKTTTASLLAWILEASGLSPSFLIGGVAENFSRSARLTKGDYFVIEADEYDTAYFDKRAKFIHYRPDTLILNNLEFDHADIYRDLDDIKRQFHHLVRTLPGSGSIVQNAVDNNLEAVVKQGCWTPCELFNKKTAWHAKLLQSDGSKFEVYYGDHCYGIVDWSSLGEHNVSNALAAIVASHHVGVKPEEAMEALAKFKSVKSRLQCRGQLNGATIYDDFAHHPTAMRLTLAGLRQHIGATKQLVAVVEFGSYTMRHAYHKPEEVAKALAEADQVVLLRPMQQNDYADQVKTFAKQRLTVCDSVEEVVDVVRSLTKSVSDIVVMSNTGFGGFFEKLFVKEGVE